LLEDFASFYYAKIENNMHNKNNKNIFPIVSYSNVNRDKFIIYKENKNKSGIYHLNNLITAKSYIESSNNLSCRFSIYFSLYNIKKKGGSSIILNSILKHGYIKFSLDILEYYEPNLLIQREQSYLDLLKPEYNIKKKLVIA
jgi:hypothetical protein